MTEEFMDYVLWELLDLDGGFYPTQDVDSEGEEDKFFVWTPEEIRGVLGSDAEEFMTAYGVSRHGNLEGKNILEFVGTMEQLPTLAEDQTQEFGHPLGGFLAAELAVAGNEYIEAQPAQVGQGLKPLLCVALGQKWRPVGDHEVTREQCFLARKIGHGGRFGVAANWNQVDLFVPLNGMVRPVKVISGTTIRRCCSHSPTAPGIRLRYRYTNRVRKLLL